MAVCPGVFVGRGDHLCDASAIFERRDMTRLLWRNLYRSLRQSLHFMALANENVASNIIRLLTL